jgi:galactokinase
LEYFDFIKPGELENLPEDSQLAFARVVELAAPRLAVRLEEIGERDEEAWEQRRDAQYGFQGVIMGAARKFGIEPFAGADMPLMVNYKNEDYRQFRHDLSGYITQIMLNAADVDRSNSVPLLEERRQSLRTYVHHLREAIDQSDLPDRKKKRLHKRLDDLEQELTRGRIRYTVVVGIIMAVLATTSDLGGSYDTISKVASFIMREIGLAKEADDEQRKISYDPPAALMPPRSPEAQRRGKESVPGGFQRDEMDDEIPF